MRLAIRHRTAYAYEPAALRAALRLRLYPSVFDAQRQIEWIVRVNGEEARPLLTDGFGDQVGLWHSHVPVERVEIIAEGVVETDEASGVVRGLPDARASGVFLRDTALTEPDDAIRDLAAGAEGATGLDRLHALSAAVRAAVEYRPGVTDAGTTAARSLALGAGVCQDHAHVFIAAARALDVPARYVAGYMMAGEEPGDEMHETHGWAEAHLDGLGWVGFDASNGVCPTAAYVRLSCGLDARAASPIRGAISGGAAESLEARVDIAPASAQDGKGQAQTQQQ